MSGSLLRRAAAAALGHVRQNHRLLSAAAEEVTAQRPDVIRLADNSIRRLKELHAKESSNEGKMLRLSVEAGGCSGFQYVFSLDDKTDGDDRVFEKDGVKLVVDNISFDFVKGATIDYVEEMIRSAFVVTDNPNADGGCSCKSSFTVK